MKANCEHPYKTRNLCSGCPRRNAGAQPSAVADVAARAQAIRDRRAAAAAAVRGAQALAESRASTAVAVPGRDTVAQRDTLPGVAVYDSEPPEPIDGAELLGHLAAYFGTYVEFPSVAAHVTVSLWNAAASARERDDSGIGPLIWRALALLGLTSSENKSGKSTVMDLTGMVLGVQRPLKITGRTCAHKLGSKHQALLLDEAKVTFGAGAASRDVQAVMLGAYSRRGTWEYQRGNASVEIPCFGPVAYAAKDELITATGEQLVDIFDRTIFIRMRRPASLRPQPDDQAEEDGAMLGDALAQWTSAVGPLLRERARELADLDYRASMGAAEDGREIDARRPQIWRPLLAVADVAGGPWPKLARQAMRELTEGAATIEGTRKLSSLRDRSARWAPVSFLASPAQDDEDDGEDELDALGAEPALA